MIRKYSKVKPVVSTICSVCYGDKKILNKNCLNCAGTGYIHKEIK